MRAKPHITTDLGAAIRQLQAGKLVAVPTETVYGLAADATQPAAIASVFELKNRPRNHPLIMHFGTTDQAWRYARQIPQFAYQLAEAFWPGPLTMVLACNDSVDTSITANQDSVAIRVPDHPLTLQLLHRLQSPIVAPSANRFGRVSPTIALHVLEEFCQADLLILDGGPCQIGIESTIIDCRLAERIQILRPGKITSEDIRQVLDDPNLLCENPVDLSMKVSGNMPAHYAPQANVILIEANAWGEHVQKSESFGPKSMFISCSSPPERFPGGTIWKCIPPELDQLAQKIYGYFREADQLGLLQIIVELPAATGIGIAIRDRLQRAAYRKRN